MPNQESPEVAEPCIGPLDDPAALVAAQFPSVFVTPLLVVLSIWCDQFDASLLQSLAQRVRVIGTIGDHPFRLLPRAAFGPGDADFFERGFRKRSFSRRGTFKPNSQRKTLTVDQYHPLRSLAPLGFADCGAPFWLAQNCRPEMPRPIAAVLLHPRRQTMSARRRAKHLALPTASSAASRSPVRDTCQAETARWPRSTIPRECPPGTPGSMPRGGRDYPGDAWALATAAQGATTAHPSTVQIDACSLFKWAKLSPASRSNSLEAEPIYETDSSQYGVTGSSALVVG
jgi:hypothetical protein